MAVAEPDDVDLVNGKGGEAAAHDGVAAPGAVDRAPATGKTLDDVP